MARENNFLLGNGERLTKPIKVDSGGGSKNPPYDFTTAKGRVAAKLATVRDEMAHTPGDAFPGGEAVAVLTMHPRYISKSDYPRELLAAVGLRAIGSRSRTVQPDKWGIDKHPVEAVTEDLFVAGPRDAFKNWADRVARWTESTSGASELSHIEDIAPFRAPDKIKAIPKDRPEIMLEVVLHNGGGDRIVEAFIAYAKRHGARPLINRRRDVQGLTFLPVRAAPGVVEELARFSFLRVVRGMPTLHPFRPGLARAVRGFPVRLPLGGPLDATFRAAVFDGGLTPLAQSVLAPWVRPVEPPGIGPAHASYQEHGLAVTTALLFGPLSSGASPPRPICPVDHVRVLDQRTGANADLEYVDVLDRILAILDEEGCPYEFINISLGPKLPVDDDEVTAWTASLDERFARGRLVATVAVGNDGHRDAGAGLNRVQPPSDCVNVLSVGAADSSGEGWARAGYSCVGPGRSPGLVKPDGIAFGGSDAEPFMVLALGPSPVAEGTQGTSIAAPFVLRSAVAVRAQLGAALGPLAIRALLIHRAEPAEHDRNEVGWGRFEADPAALVTCEDDESLVVFQGSLPVNEHLRAPLPMPRLPLKGKVVVSATLVIGPEVDPEHPAAYTRSGLGVAFRPHDGKFTKYRDGGSSKHPKTIAFFSPGNMYGAAEYEMRDDGYKWEPCLRNAQRFLASSLHNPCFDIYYNHRESAARAPNPQPIPYAFIVGINAPKVPDLYSQVVRAYSHILVPIRPRLRIGIRT